MNTTSKIVEKKIQSFSMGLMGGNKGKSRKSQQDLKVKEDQNAVQEVYQEFVSTFENDSKSKLNKSWIKAGTFNAGSRKEDTTGKGQLYRPSSNSTLLSNITNNKTPTSESGVEGKSKKSSLNPNSLGIKKKSNLELFKEELKAIQEERDERHRIKSMVKGENGGKEKKLNDGPFSGLISNSDSNKSSSKVQSDYSALIKNEEKGGSSPFNYLSETREKSYEITGTECSTSTNLYLGNLNPKVSEQTLMELFGQYGPLASIKVMWPRTDEEKARGKNCGFAAYMCRKDAENAFNAFDNTSLQEFELRLGWGKAVQIPMHPIYVPQKLQVYYKPGPPNGLPFNCFPLRPSDVHRFAMKNIERAKLESVPCPNKETDLKLNKQFRKMVRDSKVMVVVPQNRSQLCLINRMVEFVIREGPLFEALIMNREINNEKFAFLFNNRCPDHIYYRWRLFSMLQGDSRDCWNVKPFQMFLNGSTWFPPKKNPYAEGMPEELLPKESPLSKVAEMEKTGSISGTTKDKSPTRRRKRRDSMDSYSGSSGGGSSSDNDEYTTLKKSAKKSSAKTDFRSTLSQNQRNVFENLLRQLTPERTSIGTAMIWCINHAEACTEIIECLTQSLSIMETPLVKKLARFYLLSDILHNCSIKKSGVIGVSRFRSAIQAKLSQIFNHLHQYMTVSISAKLKCEAFKQRILRVFRAWEEWSVYPQMELITLQNTFLGLTTHVVNKGSDALVVGDENGEAIQFEATSVVCNSSSGQAIANNCESNNSHHSKSDLHPKEPSAVHVAIANKTVGASGFVSSKWETVEPEQVSAQAVTTAMNCKWDADIEEDDLDDNDQYNIHELLEEGHEKELGQKRSKYEFHDIDGCPMKDTLSSPSTSDSWLSLNEKKKIDLQVMEYRDGLERGRIPLNRSSNIPRMVSAYRNSLMMEQKQSSTDHRRGSSSSSSRRTGKGRKHHREEIDRDRSEGEYHSSGGHSSEEGGGGGSTPTYDVDSSNRNGAYSPDRTKSSSKHNRDRRSSPSRNSTKKSRNTTSSSSKDRGKMSKKSSRPKRSSSRSSSVSSRSGEENGRTGGDNGSASDVTPPSSAFAASRMSSSTRYANDDQQSYFAPQNTCGGDDKHHSRVRRDDRTRRNNRYVETPSPPRSSHHSGGGSSSSRKRKSERSRGESDNGKRNRRRRSNNDSDRSSISP